MWSGRAISHEIERRAPEAPAHHDTSAAPVTPVDRALARRVQRSIDAARVRRGAVGRQLAVPRQPIASAISSRTIAEPCSASPSIPTFTSVNAT